MSSSNAPRTVTRWAVVTDRGRNLRLYGENRLEIASRLPDGERVLFAEEAGSWSSARAPYATLPEGVKLALASAEEGRRQTPHPWHIHGGLARAPWDGTATVDAQPSGRPRTT